MRSTDPRKRHLLRSLRCARSGTGAAHPDSGAAGSTAAGTQPPVYPQQPVYQQPVYPPQPAYDPADHTAEFDPEDVSQNKVIAMAAYILGTVGIIIALLAAPQSKYAAFHSRQALKLDIVSTLLLIVSAVLAFTFIVPIAGAVCIAILFVVRIICFFQVCSGKAKDAAIIGKLPFLK